MELAFWIFMAFLEKETLNVLPKQISSPLSLLAYLLFCCLSINALLLSIRPFCSELVKHLDIFLKILQVGRSCEMLG